MNQDRESETPERMRDPERSSGDDFTFDPEEWTVIGEDGRDLVLSFSNFYHSDPIRGDRFGRTFGNPVLESLGRTVLSFSNDRYLVMDVERFTRLIELMARGWSGRIE